MSLTVTNSHSQRSSYNPDTKETNKTQEPQSLWESFYNEVIVPTIEDTAYSYIDDNYGTNLAEQKQQRELEKSYEEALAKEEAKNNRGLGDIANDLLGELLVDGINYYCDTNFDTNLTEKKEAQEAQDAKLLEEAKAYKAEQEQQTGQFSLLNLLISLFSKK